MPAPYLRDAFDGERHTSETMGLNAIGPLRKYTHFTIGANTPIDVLESPNPRNNCSVLLFKRYSSLSVASALPDVEPGDTLILRHSRDDYAHSQSPSVVISSKTLEMPITPEYIARYCVDTTDDLDLDVPNDIPNEVKLLIQLERDGHHVVLNRGLKATLLHEIWCVREMNDPSMRPIIQAAYNAIERIPEIHY